MRSRKPILLVEDDRVDAMTVKRALGQIDNNSVVYTVGNGEEALEFLRNARNERPAIILLDLNMPRMNGIEFLRIAKADADLKRIPVIVLTTSKQESEKVESFNLGAAGYIIKPLSYEEFLEMVKAIDRYWSISELPE
jgi:DNA-binding response OmpR family regulator